MTDTPALTQANDALAALHELALQPGARYQELLAVPARFAMRALGTHSASLSRWERDRGLLRTLVNAGARSVHEELFPRDETYGVANDSAISTVLTGEPSCYSTAQPDLPEHARALLDFSAQRSALSLPLFVDERLWGELWVGRSDDSLTREDLADARAVAQEVSTMVAVAEHLQRIARMAYEDALTGLGNRRILDDTLVELLHESGPGTTVVLCDIDNLKDINDELGHAVGDRAIVATADALAAAANAVPGSVTVRLGGDEFVVLLVGEQRATAISLVEAAAAALSSSEPPVEISCGVAVVPPGLARRDALDAADAAQYAAKARGALLVVASDLSELADDRRRSRRRFIDRRHAPQTLSQGVTDVVTDLAELLADAPESVGARLRWLGERLLAPLNLQEWSLSHADLAGDRVLSTDSLGLRHTALSSVEPHDLQVDARFGLDDYPLSTQAIERDAWFALSVDDELADPRERAVLQRMDMRYVVVLGCRDDTDGWLLEMFGRSEDQDLRVVGSLLSLAASALLHRTFVPLGEIST